MKSTHSKSQSSGLLRMIVGAAATVFFAVYSVVDPETKYFSLWAVMIGAVGTWGLYLSWRRKRDRHGLDLLDEDE